MPKFYSCRNDRTKAIYLSEFYLLTDSKVPKAYFSAQAKLKMGYLDQLAVLSLFSTLDYV
jgi:hypothetical protein